MKMGGAMTIFTIPRILFSFVSYTAIAFSGNFALAAENDDFKVGREGQIEVRGGTYRGMLDYVQSKDFRDIGGRCATDRMVKRFPMNDFQAKSQGDCTSILTVIKEEYTPNITITVPIWFHVIQQSAGSSVPGAISNERINQQIQVMNEDFQAIAGTIGAAGINTKLQFELVGITNTINAEWYSDSNSDEFAYKTALNRDPGKYLNVYTNDAQGNLGYAYYPTSNVGILDGVVMLSDSIGGRNNGFSIYNQGRTLVHEVGHYLGLPHTFEGGGSCSNTFSTGDLVVDTNAESSPFYGDSSGASCPSRNTCGTPDPVDNYMDYNIDSCMERFTAQQANRMICSVVNYRPGFVSVEDKKGNVIPILDLLLN